MALRVLVVDDTVTYRKIVSDALSNCADVTVTATASSGETALRILGSQELDLVLCDIHMPGLNGVETLVEIRKRWPGVMVVMMSGISSRSADITIRALEKGALDFIQKPDSGSTAENSAQLKRDLDLVLRLVRTRISTAQVLAQLKKRPDNLTAAPASVIPVRTAIPRTFSILAIGVSTGGPEALNKLIPALPAHLGIPVVLVQHMPAGFTKSLAESLQRKSKVDVREAIAGEPLKPDTVYIAPGGHHMVVRKGENGTVVGINEEPPENSCRPSVDVLFRSVASLYGSTGILSVILTGMGNDGCAGVRMLKRYGCFSITQEAHSCVVYGMPRAVDEAGLSDLSLPIERIGEAIVQKLIGANADVCNRGNQ